MKKRVKGILGLLGSPRLEGNSHILLKTFLHKVEEAGFESKIIPVYDLNINPCVACDACKTRGICTIKDDMDFVFKEVLQAKGLVVSAPIYFGGIPAQLKALIDRFQPWWYARYVHQQPIIHKEEHRKGFYLGVGGQPFDACQGSRQVIKTFFTVLAFKHVDDLCFSGYDEPGSVQHSAEVACALEKGSKHFAKEVLIHGDLTVKNQEKRD